MLSPERPAFNVGGLNSAPPAPADGLSGLIERVTFHSEETGFAVLLGVCILVSAGLYFLAPRDGGQMPEQKNPAEIKAAFVFTGLYAGVLLAVAAAKEYFGSAGLYVVSVVSGLTDMDAITLSTARLAETGGVDKGTAWRAIVVAAMANFAFKLGVVASLAKGALTARVAAAFGIAMASGAALIFLWPK